MPAATSPTAPPFNPSQTAALAAYNGGDHLVERPEDVATCGDGLLKFLMDELSTAEGVETPDEGLRRVERAIAQLHDVADALERAVIQADEPEASVETTAAAS